MADVDALLLEIEKSGGPNARGLLGNPILLDWIEARNEPAAIRVLSNGANAMATGKDGESALQLAAENALEDAVRLLLTLGVERELRSDGHPTALFRAARKGDVSMATVLLEGACAVDGLSYGSETPLMSACENGHIDMVDLLLSCGANPNAASASGWTSLLHSATGGCPEIAKRLILYGADPTVRDESGYNATDWARIKYDVMVSQGFRNLGIADIYTLNKNLRLNWVPQEAYEIFISYKQLHFSKEADALEACFGAAGKCVFIDRSALAIDPRTTRDKEELKAIFARILEDVRLTLFFEKYWDGSHGEPALDFHTLDWQLFELLHSRNALLISPETRSCRPFVLIPGSRLATSEGFAFTDYPSLAHSILEKYFNE